MSDMTEAAAIQWGEEEATLMVRKFNEAREDGYTREEAVDMAVADRNHAAVYIDVPRAWQAYRDTVVAAIPELRTN